MLNHPQKKDAHSPWKASPVMSSAPEEEWSLQDEDLLLILAARSDSLDNLPVAGACFEVDSKTHMPLMSDHKSLVINLAVSAPYWLLAQLFSQSLNYTTIGQLVCLPR